MGKIILYTAVSLDGYIADATGSVAWLDDYFGVDFGFSEFLHSVGTLILGRVTYDQMIGFGKWPYSGKKAFVLTRDAGALAAQAPDGVEFYKGDVRALVNTGAENDPGVTWLIGGAKTNAQFLQYGLIEEIHVALMPVTLGRGLPLFTPVQGVERFRLLGSKQLDNGVMMMRYSRSAKAPTPEPPAQDA